MTTLAAKTSPKSAVALADFPIAQEQIIEGNPTARIWIAAQSPDLKVTQGVWDCTTGKFSWDYTWDEFIMALEGEATITFEEGDSVTLREGDFIHLPVGVKSQWHVPEYFKKTFVLRTEEPLAL